MVPRRAKRDGRHADPLRDGTFLELTRWGLIPCWREEGQEGTAVDPGLRRGRLFNARAESVADKPMFRDARKRRRSIIMIWFSLAASSPVNALFSLR